MNTYSKVITAIAVTLLVTLCFTCAIGYTIWDAYVASPAIEQVEGLR